MREAEVTGEQRGIVTLLSVSLPLATTPAHDGSGEGIACMGISEVAGALFDGLRTRSRVCLNVIFVGSGQIRFITEVES